jgi:hypothetical protein
MFGRNYPWGRGGGMGLGFRGSSPPWPYVGRGRGGLPRCGYYFGGGADYATYAPCASPEQEVEFLKRQAQTLKEELEKIEVRIDKLSADKA